MTADTSRRARARHWAGALAFGGAALALLWIWLVADRLRQERVLFTLGVLLFVAIAGLAALFTWRGPRRRAMRWVGAATVLALAASPALLRVRGVTGDFLPIVEWRWQARADAALPIPAPLPPREADPATEVRPAAGAGDAVSEAAEADGEGAPDATADGTTSVEATAPASPWAGLSYPQFLGPRRNGVVPAVALARDWEARPPRLVWRTSVGTGWSGFAIDRGLAITQEQRGDDEMVVAYEVATGAVRWGHADPIRYSSVVAGDGPRATPTIAGRYVVTLGSTGLLNVIEFATGRGVWQTRIGADTGAVEPQWGRSGSPLVVDGRVIVSAGGTAQQSLVAYDLATGERVWAAGDDYAGYASPMVATLAGRRQIVILNSGSVAGHDPATGAVLWSQPWSPQQPNVTQPVPLADDLLLVATGYGVGAKLLRLTADDSGAIAPVIVWESPRLKPKFANLVVHDGFVYGLDDGILVCLDPATGERRWKAGRYGHGQVILAGDLLLVQSEDGEVVLIDPSPDGLREVTRFEALSGKTWNPPALAGRYLLVRNDHDAAMYELPLR